MGDANNGKGKDNIDGGRGQGEGHRWGSTLRIRAIRTITSRGLATYQGQGQTHGWGDGAKTAMGVANKGKGKSNIDGGSELGQGQGHRRGTRT